jgi:predicted DNA-binding protein with PD1-like motif
VEVGSESNFIVIRLADGEDLIKSLERAAEEQDFSSAMVLSGIGMLRSFTLGYFEDGEYQKETYEVPYELASLQGSFAKCDDEMMVHLHGVLAGSDHKSVGGHVFGGTVNGLAEITILKLSEVELYRELNEKTKLKELHIR